MRKLASIQKIRDIQPIVDADSIEVATINSWKVVIKKNEFKVGELVIYIECDSWVPTELAPFLSKNQEPREYNGVKGERLRTVRLRKTLSQGLILPLQNDPSGIYVHKTDISGEEFTQNVVEGDDVTNFLNIQKYEPPIPAQLSGIVKGAWPSSIPKTNEERCLSGDTIIKTNQGLKSIREICDNKLQCTVLSFNHITQQEEFKVVAGWFAMTRKNGWLKITTKSGKCLTVTKNHKIWVDDLQCYRVAAELSVGDLVKIYSQN